MILSILIADILHHTLKLVNDSLVYMFSSPSLIRGESCNTYILEIGFFLIRIRWKY